MSRWGRCDFSQFREFAKGFEKLSDSEIDDLCVACSKEASCKASGARYSGYPSRQVPERLRQERWHPPPRLGR